MMAPFIIFHDLRVVLVLVFFKEVFAMGVVIFILRNKMVSKTFNIELSLMLVVELLRYLTTNSLLNKKSPPPGSPFVCEMCFINTGTAAIVQIVPLYLQGFEINY